MAPCASFIYSLWELLTRQTILPLEVAKSKKKADSYHTPFVSSVFDKYTQNCSLLFLSVFIPSVFVFMLKNK